MKPAKKNRAFRRGALCCTYRCCLWILAGCVRVAQPVFSLLYIRCTKLRILMGETIPLYRAMTSHFLWASRTMPLHKQGRELRSEQPAPPYMSRVPLLVFLCLNNSETFVELVGATPLHLLSQTALPLKSPIGAFIAPLRCANAVPPQTLLRTDEEELCQIDTIPPQPMRINR